MIDPNRPSGVLSVWPTIWELGDQHHNLSNDLLTLACGKRNNKLLGTWVAQCSTPKTSFATQSKVQRSGSSDPGARIPEGRGSQRLLNSASHLKSCDASTSENETILGARRPAGVRSRKAVLFYSIPQS